MPLVVFVAPFFLETTLRFVRATASVPGVRTALLCQDDPARLDPQLRQKLAGVLRLGDALDPQQLADGVRAISRKLGPVDRLFGALEQLQIPLGQVRDLLQIDGVGEATARNYREKSRMKDVLRAAGLPCARHKLVATLEQAVAFVEEVGFPVVVKPADGAGGIATSRATNLASLRVALAACRPSAGNPALVEEFLQGSESSFETVCIRGTPVWSSWTHYHPAPLDVLENPWIQWTVLLPRELDDPHFTSFRPYNHAALKALGAYTGISHMEWFRRTDGTPAISEVGVRPPGAQIMTLMSHAHQTDLYTAWARLMCLDQFDPPQRRYAAGAAYLRLQGQGSHVKAVHGLERAQRELGKLVVDHKLPQVGQRRSTSYEGEGFVILRHPDTRVVSEGLKRLVQLVQVEAG